jgi:hypothetical protein
MLFAQDIERAAGVRLGHTSAITYKKFVTEQEAFELMLSGRNEGMQMTGLYLFHQPLEVGFDKHIFFYYGVGAHVGYERFDDLTKVVVNEDPLEFIFEEKSYFVMGADVMTGVEYRILTVPMTIGFEIKPYFNFIGMRYIESRFWDAGFSFKYVF